MAQKQWSSIVSSLCLVLFFANISQAQTCPPVDTGCAVPAGFTEINRGSSVLKHAQIQVLFWGSDWTSPFVTAHPPQITGAFQDMVNGPYFWVLNQYSDVSLPRLIPFVDMVTGTSPGTYPTFTEADLTSMVRGEMTAGHIPKPHAGLDMLYIVVTPPGWFSSLGSTVGGRHFVDTYNGTQYSVGWVTTPFYGSLYDPESPTKILDTKSRKQLPTQILTLGGRATTRRRWRSVTRAKRTVITT